MMKIVKVSTIGALALFLGVTAASAGDVLDQGRKGAWTWKQNVASTEIGSGVKLIVVFSSEDNCDLAMLMVSGNTNITELGLTVDGHFYSFAEMTHAPGTEITGVVLGPSVLSGIKNGSSAKVTTNVGSASMSLSGSAKAINAAYGNCLDRAKPIVASAPAPATREPPSHQTKFVGKKVRADGSTIFAAHDVVFVLGNIQVGDDRLLQELVAEMEDAGIPFKSVVFAKNDGGALRTAMEMGKFIRSKGANTAIGGYPTDDGVPPHCASACVYAFAGGVQRTIYLPARIGMHQASLMDGSDGTMEDGQRVVADKYDYLSRMGVDPEMVIEGSKRGPNEMWWMTGYEAKGYGLVTRITKAHETSAVTTRLLADDPALAHATAQPRVAGSATAVGASYPARYRSVSAPSFRCAGDLQPNESIICQDPGLARADGVMGAIYQDLRAALSNSDANSLRSAQRGWLKQRDLACPTSAADVRSSQAFTQAAACLRRMTDRRIADLYELLAPSSRQ